MEITNWVKCPLCGWNAKGYYTIVTIDQVGSRQELDRIVCRTEGCPNYEPPPEVVT